ncbi:hypothetical protein BAE44_0019367 [Dichanthelium oligosanthes]|uniref:Transcription factor CBF/NF-Y/archaeal histone domain-containing protein n=1 Tax=Dichanthelium oligosanthes TaxID=888268 RepID=A0A1E5V3J5_9POAL|nr:hypothetical protein BAE44_0019367 [Dichanthelium oligosanthes]
MDCEQHLCHHCNNKNLMSFGGRLENTVNFNNHILPVLFAEISRDTKGSFMMSSDTPPVLTKLLDIFIQELTVRASMCATSHDRSTILEPNIYEVINSHESYVFLNDVLPRHGTNPNRPSMSSNSPQLLQESLVATSILIENGPTDPCNKSGEQDFQFSKDNLVPTINAQPNPMELKNEDLNNMSATSSGSIEETK